MKIRNFFLTATLIAAAAVMVSCNDNDDSNNNDPAVVKFTSGIAVPQPRVGIDPAGNSVWEAGDAIGIYMIGNGGTTVEQGAENIRFTANTAGTSTSFTPAGNPIYYPLDETKKVDFIAYHPHSATLTNYVYPVDVSSQTSQTALDLLWTRSDNSGAGYDKNSGRNNTAVNFEFDHQLVKLVFTVISGTGAPTDLSTMTVSINGMNTTATFDLKGVDGLTGEGGPAVITPLKQADVYTYEAILLPVAALGAAHTVTFGIGTETYTWNMSNDITSLDAGSIYTYDITLTKYEVNVTGSINSWSVGTPGNGIAD